MSSYIKYIFGYNNEPAQKPDAYSQTNSPSEILSNNHNDISYNIQPPISFGLNLVEQHFTDDMSPIDCDSQKLLDEIQISDDYQSANEIHANDNCKLPDEIHANDNCKLPDEVYVSGDTSVLYEQNPCNADRTDTVEVSRKLFDIVQCDDDNIECDSDAICCECFKKLCLTRSCHDKIRCIHSNEPQWLYNARDENDPQHITTRDTDSFVSGCIIGFTVCFILKTIFFID